MRAWVAAGLVLATAACGERASERSDGWDEKRPVQAKGEAPGTAFALRADRATGAVEMALPGAKLSLDLPAEVLKAGDFDIDGVKLYPGSTLEALDVKAFEGVAKGGQDGKVRIAFQSPAAPEVVRAWMLSSTADKERPLRAAGDALVGATKDGDAYAIRFAAADAGRTRGEIVIDSTKKSG